MRLLTRNHADPGGRGNFELRLIETPGMNGRKSRSQQAEIIQPQQRTAAPRHLAGRKRYRDPGIQLVGYTAYARERLIAFAERAVRSEIQRYSRV